MLYTFYFLLELLAFFQVLEQLDDTEVVKSK